MITWLRLKCWALVYSEKVTWYLFFFPIPSLLRDGMLRFPADWRMALGGRDMLLCLRAFFHAGLPAWNDPSPSWEGSSKSQLWWDSFYLVVFPQLDSKPLKVWATSHSPLFRLPVLWPLLSFPNLLAYWEQHFKSALYSILYRLDSAA